MQIRCEIMPWYPSEVFIWAFSPRSFCGFETSAVLCFDHLQNTKAWEEKRHEIFLKYFSFSSFFQNHRSNSFAKLWYSCVIWIFLVVLVWFFFFQIWILWAIFCYWKLFRDFPGLHSIWPRLLRCWSSEGTWRLHEEPLESWGNSRHAPWREGWVPFYLFVSCIQFWSQCSQ